MTSFSSFLVVIFAFVLIKHAMDNRARQQRDRMRLLEEALQNGSLDEKTKEDLMENLTGRRPHSPPRPPQPARPLHHPEHVGFVMKLIAFVGWMCLCLGIAFAIVCGISHSAHLFEVPAAILTCIGFGLTTYPFVIRELQSPRRGSAVHQTPEAREQRS